MILIINASSAKTGGAKSIVEKFCSEQSFEHYSKVIVISPHVLHLNHHNYLNIIKSTSGLHSFIFTILGIFYYVLKYDASKIISFNNINCILPICSLSTYVHQLLIFKSDKSLTSLVQFFTLKYLLPKSDIYVQSNYVKTLFIKEIGHKHNSINVVWPGYIPPDVYAKSLRLSNLVTGFRKYKYKICVVPIVDTSKSHKNFDSLISHYDFFYDNKIKLLVTCNESFDSDVFINVGILKRDELDALYLLADFMVFPSLEETVGLPIYEFAGLGKPVFVLNRPYLDGNPYLDSKPGNVIKYHNHNFQEKILEFTNPSSVISNFSFPFNNGCWPK